MSPKPLSLVYIYNITTNPNLQLDVQSNMPRGNLGYSEMWLITDSVRR